MKIVIIFGIFVTFAANAYANVKPSEIDTKAGINIDVLPKVQPLLDALKISLNDQYNPMTLDERHFSIDDKNLNIKLDLDIIKGALRGLLDFVVTKFTVSITFKYDINVELPKLELNISNYDLDGALGLTKISGSGEIGLSLTDIELKVKGQLNRQVIDGNKFITVKTVQPQLSIGGLDFKITGYLNDEERSKMLSKLINNVAPIALQTYGYLINNEIEKLVLKYTDGLLIPSPI